MMRFVEPDAERLRPQEMALIALCDRMTAVEQVLTLQGDTQRQLIVEQARQVADLKDLIEKLAKQLDQREAKILAQRESILVLEDRLHRMELILAARG